MKGILLSRRGAVLLGALFVCNAFLLFAAGSALSAEGDFDGAFGVMGVAAAPARDDGGTAPSEVPLAATGLGIVTTDNFGRLVRFDEKGDLDQAFVGDSAIGGDYLVADLAPYPGDKVIAVLFPRDASDGAVLARVMPDGSLDPTFGSAGLVATSGELLSGRYVAVSSGGKIALAGGTDGLHVYLPDGSPDPTFAGGTVPASPRQPYVAPAFRGDGRLLAAAGNTPEQRTVVGALDPAFGQGGRVQGCCMVAQIPGTINQIETSPDGSTYVQVSGCKSEIGPNGGRSCAAALVRLAPGGFQDAAFASAPGSSVNRLAGPVGLAVDSQGRVLSAGARGLGVARVLPDGSLDGSFGRQGVSTAYPGGCEFTPSDLAIDDLGRTIVSGKACGRHVLVRLATAGERDLDGDSVLDAVDRCQNFPGLGHNGCPTLGRKVAHVRVSKTATSGVVRVRLRDGLRPARQCYKGVRVLLQAGRKGRLLSSAKTDRRGRWSLRSNRGSNAEIVVPPVRGGSRGFCAREDLRIDQR